MLERKVSPLAFAFQHFQFVRNFGITSIGLKNYTFSFILVETTFKIKSFGFETLKRKVKVLVLPRAEGSIAGSLGGPRQRGQRLALAKCQYDFRGFWASPYDVWPKHFAVQIQSLSSGSVRLSPSCRKTPLGFLHNLERGGDPHVPEIDTVVQRRHSDNRFYSCGSKSLILLHCPRKQLDDEWRVFADRSCRTEELICLPSVSFSCWRNW